MNRLTKASITSAFSVALASLVLASPALANPHQQEGEFCSKVAYNSPGHGIHKDTGQTDVWVFCIRDSEGRLRWTETSRPQTPRPSLTPIKPPAEAATLPKTGSSTPAVATLGIALTGLGGVVLYRVRRRRIQFEA